MTKAQIKAIAEEVAHLRAFDGGFFPHEKEIREDYEMLLQWLNEKYCIVEREKVMEDVNKLLHGIFPDDMETTMYLKGREDVLKSLFGTSMFNQNEE